MLDHSLANDRKSGVLWHQLVEQIPQLAYTPEATNYSVKLPHPCHETSTSIADRLDRERGYYPHETGEMRR